MYYVSGMSDREAALTEYRTHNTSLANQCNSLKQERT